MLMKLRKKIKNQKGFTLIELLVVISIIGVLAAIAVPKFTDATAKANTAKIGADLRIIDSAIAIHQATTGADPANIGALVTAGYITSEPAKPTGKFLITGSTATAIATADAYGFNGVAGSGMRASFKGNVAEYYK